MGQCDAVAEEACDHATAAAGLEEGLGHHDHIDEVTTGSSDPFGEADAEDARRGGLAVKVPGQLTRLFPGGQVRGDLSGRELGDQGAQGAAFGSVVRVGWTRGGRHGISLGRVPHAHVTCVRIAPYIRFAPTWCLRLAVPLPHPPDGSGRQAEFHSATPATGRRHRFIASAFRARAFTRSISRL